MPKSQLVRVRVVRLQTSTPADVPLALVLPSMESNVPSARIGDAVTPTWMWLGLPFSIPLTKKNEPGGTAAPPVPCTNRPLFLAAVTIEGTNSGNTWGGSRSMGPIG